MTTQELREAHARFAGVLGPLLPLFGRLERRDRAQFYVQGLLLEGGRKTAATMANRFGGDEQSVQQFLNQSPWDWMPIRAELARHAVAHFGSRAAWLLDDTGFPKKGAHSVGVARQYSGTLGKVGNCQIGVSLNYATDDGSFPLDMQLYLPEAWTDDISRRAKAGVPAGIVFKRKWEIGLEMIDRTLASQIPVGVVVADAGYGIASAFRAALRDRGLSYVVGVTRETTAWTLPRPQAATVLYRGMGRPRKPVARPAISALQIAREVPSHEWSEVTWREGTKGPMRSRFAAIRVEPAHGEVRGTQSEPPSWLLVEWPTDSAEPTKYFLANLPEGTALQELVYWAKIRWWIEQGYQHLKDELGLDHFEGRSWQGWHHHVTLTLIAFAFLAIERLRQKKQYWVDTPARQAGAAASAAHDAWILPSVPETHAHRRYLT